MRLDRQAAAEMMQPVADTSFDRPFKIAWRPIWDFLPSVFLFVALLAPPFAGTITLYRIAMFGLMAHTAIEFRRRRPEIDVSTKWILLLGGLFTAWSLLSSIYGIDPRYSIGRWKGEHLYVYLFFCAVVLNPAGFSIPLTLAGGILSVICIAIGVMVDWSALKEPARILLHQMGLDTAADENLWKATRLRGFSSDITWLTGHVILLQWIALTTLLIRPVRSPLFWLAVVAAAAGLWVVLQTFQVAAFLVIFATTFVFLCIGMFKTFGRKAILPAAGLCALLLAVFVIRDSMHPERRSFEGFIALIKTGRTENLHVQSRLNGVLWALDKIPERPWLGWGAGREILRKVEPKTFDITENVVPDLSRHPPIGHLHNQYADLLVRTGIPGLLFYTAFLLAILIAAIRLKLWKQDWRSKPGACIRMGAALCVLFMLIRLLMETYPASSVGFQYWLVLALAATPASAWLPRLLPARTESKPPRSTRERPQRRASGRRR